MNLHRADRADWELISPENWNVWQRVAARTSGIVAPANFVSLIGALVAFYALHLIWIGSVTEGVVLLGASRLADVLDGIVADYTKTKSPFGEGFDATTDKVIILLSLVIIYWQSLLPWPIFTFLVLTSAYNALIGFYADFIKKKGVHPSQSGKVSSVFAWITILLFILSTQVERPGLEVAMKWAGVVFFIVFLVGTLIGSYGYTKAAFKR